VASQNTVFKASDAEICTPVTKLITNDRIKHAIRAFDAKLSVTGATDLRPLDGTGHSSAPAMATADEATPAHAVEPIFVVLGLFLVVGAAPSGQFQRVHPAFERLAVSGVNAGCLVLIDVNKFVTDRLLQGFESRPLVGFFGETNRTVAAAI
jgi:hypothetical protein